MNGCIIARTEENVRRSDATLWFGSLDTAGAKATLRACRGNGTPPHAGHPGPRHQAVRRRGVDHAGRVQGAQRAGNRETKAPGIGARVERFMGEVFRQVGHDWPWGPEAPSPAPDAGGAGQRGPRRACNALAAVVPLPEPRTAGDRGAVRGASSSRLVHAAVRPRGGASRHETSKRSRASRKAGGSQSRRGSMFVATPVRVGGGGLPHTMPRSPGCPRGPWAGTEGRRRAAFCARLARGRTRPNFGLSGLPVPVGPSRRTRAFTPGITPSVSRRGRPQAWRGG